MVKTVLITGAMGFIGRNIAREFKNQGYYVIGIGHGDANTAALLEAGIDEWHEASINLAALKGILHNPDIIVHCAGGSTVGASLNNPYLDFNKTVNSTLEVLEYIRTVCTQASLIYLSSAAVYGTKDDELIKEDDDLVPVSPYGFHKMTSESVCRSYSISYGIKVVIVRLFSIYGAGLAKQLLWDASNRIINTNQNQIEFHGTGNETRDWMHVTDAARLVTHLADCKEDFVILNGGFGEKHTVKEVLQLLVKELGKENIEITFNNVHKAGDPKHYHADISNAIKMGWKPTIKLTEGLKSYAKWFNSII